MTEWNAKPGKLSRGWARLLLFVGWAIGKITTDSFYTIIILVIIIIQHKGSDNTNLISGKSVISESQLLISPFGWLGHSQQEDVGWCIEY